MKLFFDEFCNKLLRRERERIYHCLKENQRNLPLNKKRKKEANIVEEASRN